MYVCVRESVCYWVLMCVCVPLLLCKRRQNVFERESEREKKRERQRNREREKERLMTRNQ
jgi:hypothetical protein